MHPICSQMTYEMLAVYMVYASENLGRNSRNGIIEIHFFITNIRNGISFPFHRQKKKNYKTIFVAQYIFFVLKESQLGVFCPQAIGYCYLKFKLRYLKNQKLFPIRVKESFEPIVLRNKGDGVFALFISICLRNRSLSNARCFYGKKTQNWEGKSEFN